jgi:tRNA_anti-like
MSIKKMLLVAIPVIICVALGVAYYEYNKPVQDVAELKAQPVTAVALFKDFTSNEPKANISYLNKALEVSGQVLEVKHTQNKQLQIILDSGDPMFGIACTMDTPQKNVKPGDVVTIKGICTGYLNDVVIIKSLLLN